MTVQPPGEEVMMVPVAWPAPFVGLEVITIVSYLSATGVPGVFITVVPPAVVRKVHIMTLWPPQANVSVWRTVTVTEHFIVLSARLIASFVRRNEPVSDTACAQATPVHSPQSMVHRVRNKSPRQKNIKLRFILFYRLKNKSTKLKYFDADFH